MRREVLILLALVLLSLPLGQWPFQNVAATDTPTASNVCAGTTWGQVDIAGLRRVFEFGGHTSGFSPSLTDCTAAVWVATSGAGTSPRFNTRTELGGPALPDGDAGDLCRITVYNDNSGTVIETIHAQQTCPADNTQIVCTTCYADAGTHRTRLEIIQANEAVGNYNLDTDARTSTAKAGAYRAGLKQAALGSASYPSGSTFAYTVAGESVSLPYSFTDVSSGQVGTAQLDILDGAGATVKSSSLSLTGTGGTATAAVDDTFPASASTYGARISIPSSATSALTGVRWTHVSTATSPTVTDGEFAFKRTDYYSVDPRVTATHLMQGDTSFSTPPMSENDADDTRYATDLNYVATRFTNARSEGLSGASFAFSSNLYDTGLVIGTTERFLSGLTVATAGGQAGWGPLRLFNDGAPTGSWTKTVDVTAPAAIDADGHLVTATKTYTVAAPPTEGGDSMGDPLKLFVSHQEATGGDTILFAASEAFLDGTARTANAAGTDGYLYDPSGDLIQNAVATTELHAGIYTWTYTLPASPEQGNWVVVVQALDPSTSDPVTSANTFHVGNTSIAGMAASLEEHRNGTLEVNAMNFEGYTFGEITMLWLFIAMFLWGGYSRQLWVTSMGVIGIVLVSITTPDLPVKWVILMAVLGSATIAIRNSWKNHQEERNQAEKEM